MMPRSTILRQAQLYCCGRKDGLELSYRDEFMIEAMRGTAVKWVIRILACLLILSFAVWGVGDIIPTRTADQTVASVGGTTIEYENASSEVGRLLNLMRRQVGPDFDLEQAARLGLIDQTVDQMVNGRLLELEAATLKLAVGEELIRQTIFADPRFQGPGNRFDRTAYEQTLRQEGISEGMFVSIIRENILRRQISSALTSSSRVPSAMLDAIYRYRNEQRVADVVTVPAGQIADIPEPSPAELAKFHKENPARFTKPETRSLTLVYLDPAKAAKELRPDEKRILEEYEIRKETQGIPERRALEQVLLQDEEAAAKIAAAVKQGSSLDDAAKSNGATVSFLGALARRDLPAPVATAAFALPAGGVTSPVKTALGWHVLRVRNIEPGRTPTLEALQPVIVNDIAREMAVDTFIALTQKLDDALAAGTPLQDAANGIGAPVTRIAALDASGNDGDGKPVSNIPRDAQFTDLVFGTAKGETTNIEEARDGGYYVFRVDDVVPPQLQPLDAVRNLAIQAWKETQLQDSARKRAAALLDTAKTGGSLKQAAEKAGLSVVSSKPFTRFIRDPNSAVSPALSAEIFKLKPGALAMAASRDGYAVGELKSIVAADPGANKAETDALRSQLQAALANDQIDQYLNSLRKRYPVKVNSTVVQTLVTGRGGN